ncbi:hypothetical protein KIN20_011249 [Parelaphostrongylus tenuis]|uniref:Uncharacterized protein n=1 Tax=Parelaphostrongylus tenuis TaxID=148309 RepID=A0AAD5QKX6_PARTN|nr:hypothetical protein KIN20_011249 [Parelaphostrongylus tenuis]
MDKLPHCIIFANTVTALCTGVPGAPPPPNDMCDLGKNHNIVTVPSKHLSISGALTVWTAFSSFISFLSCKENSFQTTNIVMANWSRDMWQNVVNRAVRMLASPPFGSHFFSASATVS